jgi:hypothetical protein
MSVTPYKTVWTQRLIPNNNFSTCCQRTRCRDLSSTTSLYWSIFARTGGVGSHQVTTFPLESACLHMATRLVHHNYSQFAPLLVHPNSILWLWRIQAHALYASQSHAPSTAHYHIETKVQNLSLYERTKLAFFFQRCMARFHKLQSGCGDGITYGEAWAVAHYK